MAKTEVPPYFSWLEEIVLVASGLDPAEKQFVVDAIRTLAARVRRSARPWHEHVFALAIARYAFSMKLPAHEAARTPIAVCIEAGKVHTYITDSERISFALEDAGLQLQASNLLGLVQTVEGFRADKWKTDEFVAATHLADAQIHLLDEQSDLARNIFHLVARCLFGMDPEEPDL